MSYDLSPLLDRLSSLSEREYAAFNAGTVPGVAQEIMGVRMPVLRKLSKELAREADWRGFLDASREHPVYEIRMLHAMVLGGAKCEMDEKVALIDAFLPFVDNWAVCDGLVSSFKPKASEMERLFEFVCACAESDIEFRKRFGLVMMMARFNKPPYLEKVMACYRGFRHDGYYARMGAAWGLATLWLSDREGTLSILQDNLWDDFTHNKAIQKLRESWRVSDDDKALVQALRRRAART